MANDNELLLPAVVISIAATLAILDDIKPNRSPEPEAYKAQVQETLLKKQESPITNEQINENEHSEVQMFDDELWNQIDERKSVLEAKLNTAETLLM